MRVPHATLVSLLLLFAACGTTQPKLSREELGRLPVDGRTAIFDAENDVVIALSRRDEAADRARALEEARADLDDRWDKAKALLKARRQEGGKDRAESAFDARRIYLSRKQKVAELQVDAATVDVQLARARLDVVRQVQLARVGRAPRTDVAALEKRVTTLEQDLKDATRKALDADAEAQKAFESWKSAEEAYAGSSGDYDAVVWVE